MVVQSLSTIAILGVPHTHIISYYGMITANKCCYFHKFFLGAITVFGEVLLEDVFMVGLSMMCNQLSQKFKILFLFETTSSKSVRISCGKSNFWWNWSWWMVLALGSLNFLMFNLTYPCNKLTFIYWFIWFICIYICGSLWKHVYYKYQHIRMLMYKTPINICHN